MERKRSQDADAFAAMMPRLVGEGVQTSQEITMKWYSDYSELYDRSHSERGLYLGPVQCADAVAERLSINYDARILDVASGSGILGQELLARGYRRIDGLDPNGDMLAIARSKGIYGHLYKAYLGQQDSKVPKESYDMVCACGGFVPGHIPSEGLLEMAKFVKPGGYQIIVMRNAYLEHQFYKDTFPQIIQRMIDEGMVEDVKRVVTRDYFDGYDGLVIVLRKL